MKRSEFCAALRRHPDSELAFILPDGNPVPIHAHVTEVGRTHKRFLDCGGTLREEAFCSLQVWVAEDLEHRLPSGRLAAIMDQADFLFGPEDPEMQVESQRESLSLFAIENVAEKGGTLAFTLASRNAACLAIETCLPQTEETCCSPASGCCR